MEKTTINKIEGLIQHKIDQLESLHKNIRLHGLSVDNVQKELEIYKVAKIEFGKVFYCTNNARNLTKKQLPDLEST